MKKEANHESVEVPGRIAFSENAINRDWQRTSDSLPLQGALVETKIHDQKGERNHARLFLNGRLWFLADGSMYVYYVPTHWRELL